jgi:hypothetical protein
MDVFHLDREHRDDLADVRRRQPVLAVVALAVGRRSSISGASIRLGHVPAVCFISVTTLTADT